MKNTLKKLLCTAIVPLALSCSAQKQVQPQITVKGTQFYKGDKPYHYIGTNYWYGALLAAKDGGNRVRLAEELDQLKANGIDNLRILVGAEGGTQDFTVTPALQSKQGEYNQNLLNGLDYLLNEMGKRGMYAVLYLNNNWEWSGGMSQYLEWNGYGPLPNPNIKPNTWPQFMEYTKQFHKCEPCIKAFDDHIKYILGRTNPYSKKKYTEDTTIMAWQIANEPRVFTADNEAAFTKWLNGVVDLIDSLDKNHLICTGSEGKAGSADDAAIFERTHNNSKIDYLTMHIWPKNWGWYNHTKPKETLPPTIDKTLAYIDEHVAIAKRLGKPIVLEEFGLPREGESLSKQSSTADRDAFYKAIFERLEKSIKNKETFTALNFWGYGGTGKNNPDNGKWKKGDDFTADPPQEPQGLNSVFSTDTSTLNLIKEYNSKIRK
ncbi:glycoside hydrolase 5 family protein [Flavobacterium sp. AG291]|uniref:glycoside hydrolase 5 family protein n=1 Tax=Flavobacterium sp. AG291 TaxID=2184000 RepID=UPI000E0C4B61|nr:cellulase family glycosylhydrolase [Flavobacterium sp. AG291]RDI14604.1 mannan endo-1,4-beta-mannosidase [Flavobacterium sp. AG291]